MLIHVKESFSRHYIKHVMSNLHRTVMQKLQVWNFFFKKYFKIFIIKVETSERSLYDPSHQTLTPNETASELTAAAHKLADVAMNPNLKSLPENIAILSSADLTSSSSIKNSDLNNGDNNMINKSNNTMENNNNTTNTIKTDSENEISQTLISQNIDEVTILNNSQMISQNINQIDSQKEQLIQQMQNDPQQANANRNNRSNQQSRTNSMSEKSIKLFLCSSVF